MSLLDIDRMLQRLRSVEQHVTEIRRTMVRTVVRQSPSSLGAAVARVGVFDLYEIGENTFKVKGHTFAAGIGGLFIAVGAGAAGYTCDQAITISASTYVYLKTDRALGGGTITLEIGATIPAGTDSATSSVVNKPLWYVPWDSTAGQIDQANILPMQGAVQWSIWA